MCVWTLFHVRHDAFSLRQHSSEEPDGQSLGDGFFCAGKSLKKNKCSIAARIAEFVAFISFVYGCCMWMCVCVCCVRVCCVRACVYLSECLEAKGLISVISCLKSDDSPNVVLRQCACMIVSVCVCVCVRVWCFCAILNWPILSLLLLYIYALTHSHTRAHTHTLSNAHTTLAHTHILNWCTILGLISMCVLLCSSWVWGCLFVFVLIRAGLASWLHCNRISSPFLPCQSSSVPRPRPPAAPKGSYLRAYFYHFMYLELWSA